MTNDHAHKIANLSVEVDKAASHLEDLERAQGHGVHRAPREEARARVTALRLQLADAILDATTSATGKAK